MPTSNSAPNATSSGEEHWTSKKTGDGEVRLFMWRRPRAAGSPRLGTLLLIHGSSMSSTPSYDLQIPGRASTMDWLSGRGFDCWCLDNEGYGRSSKHRPINCDIPTGADDIHEAMKYIQGVTGEKKVHMYGTSSGGLKAALFATRRPEMVGRLAVEAMVWKGTDSPTLAQRRMKLPEYLANLRRPMAKKDIESIFTRDHANMADPVVVASFTKAVLALDESIPNGTYVDMCSKLPVVDPAALDVPTLVLRGEHDGIASYRDVADFFDAIPNMDKQFVVLAGVAHGSLQGHNREVSFHVLQSFFTQPGAIKHD